MGYWKELNEREIGQLKVGDKVKVNDVETEVRKLDTVGMKTIGFTTKAPFDIYPNKDLKYFWGKHTSTNYKVYKLTGETTMKTKQFTKADLKTGMVIEQRSGSKAMVLLGTTNGDIISGQTWMPLSGVNSDLTHPSKFREYDIVKVFQPKSNVEYLGQESIWNQHNIIWEREAPKSKEQIAYDEAVEATEAARQAYELAQKKLEALNPAKK